MLILRFSLFVSFAVHCVTTRYLANALHPFSLLGGIPNFFLKALLKCCTDEYPKSERDANRLKESIFLGIFWLVMAMLVDLTGFVLIKSPVSLTPHQFYVEYQPWISITYVIVLLSPLIYVGLSKLKW